MGSLAAAIAPSAGGRAATELESVRDTLWFSGLYEDAVDNVYRYAYVLVRNAQQAEDVTADVFLKAWRGRHTLRSEASAQAWLFSIAHNSAMSLLRSQREVAQLDDIGEQEDTGADPESEVFAGMEAGRLQAAIRRLTAEQQQVVFLRFFEGLRHDEVAFRLGSNANAVRAVQFRALSRLRKLLQEDRVHVTV
jgi:RNA polymerase sigma-70 factor (ECF subfamily)